MDKDPNTNNTAIAGRRSRLLAITVAAGASVFSLGGAAIAATEDPPPFDHCRYSDHPAAADLVSLVAPTIVPSDDVRAVLRGELVVGTDCSVYDLPTDQPV